LGDELQRTLACPFFRKAFGWCVPIGGLAGLIGLGGGEFRLPVLMHGIGFDAKSAVPLNLMISLVTLTFAMASRSGADSDCANAHTHAALISRSIRSMTE